MAWHDFWKRNTDDPLMRVLFEKYKLHLLSTPTSDSLIGDVYILNGNNILARSSVTDFLNDPYQLPTVNSSEVPDIAGMLSNSVTIDIGIGFLDSFFRALGTDNLIQKVSTSLKNKGIAYLKFRFLSPTRKHVNVVRIANDLVKNSFGISENHPLYSKKNRYYLVTAVLRTSSLAIVTNDSNHKFVNIEIPVKNLLNVSSNVNVENSSEGQLTFNGLNTLAFGVEIHELNYDLQKEKFRINAMDKFVGLRGLADDIRRPVVIGDPIKGNLFLS